MLKNRLEYWTKRFDPNKDPCVERVEPTKTVFCTRRSFWAVIDPSVLKRPPTCVIPFVIAVAVLVVT